MKYQDKVYGNCIITEPIILELVNSPALKRLRDIDQGGYEQLIARARNKTNKLSGHDRLAHSIGVYLLLKKYNARLEEQIAGLIHDVSHSAFSHSIDYIVDGGSGKEQNHQDNSHNSFIKKTLIPKILKKYGFNLEYILSEKNFPLKERVLPDLCADRIDYILREGIIFKKTTAAQARNILDNLIVNNDRWIFKNFKTAKKFAQLFYKMNRDYYADFSAAIMFKTISDCLKYALGKNYIANGDLYATDKLVIAKIKKYLKKDKYLDMLWRRMNGKIKVKQNRKKYDARVFCKSRIVDPLFMDKDKIKRLSEAEPSWGKIVKQELKPKKYFLKFEK